MLSIGFKFEVAVSGNDAVRVNGIELYHPILDFTELSIARYELQGKDFSKKEVSVREMFVESNAELGGKFCRLFFFKNRVSTCPRGLSYCMHYCFIDLKRLAS